MRAESDSPHLKSFAWLGNGSVTDLDVLDLETVRQDFLIFCQH